MNLTTEYIVGDVFDVLRSMPEASVDLVMTSPPFLALRSYLPADHPDKGKEIGSEPTPADFLDTMLDVVQECRRVLTPHGSLVFELGDTYSGSGGAGGDYGEDGLRDGQPLFRAIRGDGWPLPKSLCGIPTLFAWSLAYGRNLLGGHELERWRVRNVIAWCRPNPPVGALGDKCRPATSYLTVAAVSSQRWFDMDAVRTPPQLITGRAIEGNNVKGSDDNSHRFAERLDANPAGAPLLDYWEIPTQPYAGAHYATFPEELPRRVILLMCPEKVCRVCGEPSRRIVENPNAGHGANAWNRHGTAAASFHRDVERPHWHESLTVGWTDCGHNDWRTGVVLDPFAGSGTTLRMAMGNGRSSIGIDLDERNAELARERIGPLYLDTREMNDNLLT